MKDCSCVHCERLLIGFDRSTHCASWANSSLVASWSSMSGLFHTQVKKEDRLSPEERMSVLESIREMSSTLHRAVQK